MLLFRSYDLIKDRKIKNILINRNKIINAIGRKNHLHIYPTDILKIRTTQSKKTELREKLRPDYDYLKAEGSQQFAMK